MRLRNRSLGAATIFLAVLAVASCAPPPPPAPPPAPTPVPTPVPTREVPAKVGLALGGGGARGFAEIGVLRVLEQEKIPISCVAGTSVGSLVGALYADTGRVLDAEFHAVTVTEEDLFDYRTLAVFSGGFVKGERLREFLKTNLKSKSIEQMAIPFAAVAVDVTTGRAVAFQRGPVAPAVHASCAIPGVFVPVAIGDRTYVDGGVVNPVPADVARSMGADVVIAVSIPPLTRRAIPTNPIAVAYQAVTIMSAEIARLRAPEADVVISPDVGDVAYDDFTQKKRLIAAGEEAARKALPQIRALLAAKARRFPSPDAIGPRAGYDTGVLGGPPHPKLRDLWTPEDDEDVQLFLEAASRGELLPSLSAIEGTPAADRLEAEAQVTAWAAVAARRLTVLPSRGPFALSRLLRGLLVDELGFRGDAEDYSSTRNCCIHQVLSRRKGMPILLACVWMEVGRRASIPVEGIGMPGHFLARVGGPAGVHVDPFAGGQELSREGCRNLHDRIAGPKARWNDEYLRASPPDQVLERVLNNLAATTRDEHDAAGSYRVATFLAALRPLSPERTLQKAMTAAAIGITEEAATGFAAVIERFPDSPEAERASQGLDSLSAGPTVN